MRARVADVLVGVQLPRLDEVRLLDGRRRRVGRHAERIVQLGLLDRLAAAALAALAALLASAGRSSDAVPLAPLVLRLGEDLSRLRLQTRRRAQASEQIACVRWSVEWNTVLVIPYERNPATELGTASCDVLGITPRIRG